MLKSTLRLLVLLAFALAGCNLGHSADTVLPTLTGAPTLILPAQPLEGTSPLPTTPAPTVVQPVLVEVSVFFTDSRRYQAGVPPFETPVTRQVDPAGGLPQAVLTEFFHGPTEQEHALGLELIDSGFTGFSRLEIADGIARVYLSGECRSMGATYTIAQPIMANLRQFPEIQAVKLYDAAGGTEIPDGPSNSIPFCLEP